MPRPPSEMSVSIVVARWRRLTRVAWWIGHAPHVTIGVVNARANHCHPIPMNAGIIPMAATGTASTADTTTRLRSERIPASSSGP